jgi:phage tail-like protein
MAFPGDIARLPLVAYNFRVSVAAQTIGFKDVSGLSRQHETLTYRDGLSFHGGERIVKFHNDKFVPITLKKGTIPRECSFLYAWVETKVEVPMTVSLCNAYGLAVVSWRLSRVIPVKLTPPAFDVSSNEVSIDTFEVMAAGIVVDTTALAAVGA